MSQNENYLAGYRKLAARMARIRKRYTAFLIALAASHIYFVTRPEPGTLLLHVSIAWVLMLVMVQQFRVLDETREKLWLYNNFLSDQGKKPKAVKVSDPGTMNRNEWAVWMAQFAPLASLLLILLVN